MSSLNNEEIKLSKKKKEKKHKNEKKHKKKKRKSSSSDSDDEKVETIWVEKSLEKKVENHREQWMDLPFVLKTQTRDQMRADGSSRAAQKLEEKALAEQKKKAVCASRELNPYYKNNGTGVPTSSGAESTSRSRSSSSYDTVWMRRALERAKEQAREEGCSLEDIAARRWGSLESFYKLLNEAEDGGGGGGAQSTSSCSKSKGRLQNECHHRDESINIRVKSSSKRSRSRERDSYRFRRSRSKDSSDRSSYTDKRRDEKRHFKRESRADDSSISTDDDSSSSDRKRKNARDRRRHRSRSTSSERFRSKDSSRNERSKVSSQMSLKFKKPKEDDSKSSWNSNVGRRVSDSTSSGWRKLPVEKEPSSQNNFPQKTTDSPTAHSAEDQTVGDLRQREKSPVEEHKKEFTTEGKEKDGANKNNATVLTDAEMNKLAAKLTKAELVGNTVLVEKLKRKLSSAREVRQNSSSKAMEAQKQPKEEGETEVLLTTTDARGFTRPVSAPSSGRDRKAEKRLQKKKGREVVQDGQRMAYFVDDAKTDLQSMFEAEKSTSVETGLSCGRSDALLATAARSSGRLNDDFDVDDLFVDRVAPSVNENKEAQAEAQRAIREHGRLQRSLDSCRLCVQSEHMQKHLIVALGEKSFVSVPAHVSLTEGHCIISPLQHVPCATRLDEDVWMEIKSFRQALVAMFAASDEDCVFFESVMRLRSSPHMALHCVPMPTEEGHLAPIYFKKAILECEEEWSQNKKLIDLAGRDVRRGVPKGLPYFSVDFGMQSGFAHVVEDERLFPDNFAQSIIGGMLDLDATVYRKARPEAVEAQRSKALRLEKRFEPFKHNCD